MKYIIKNCPNLTTSFYSTGEIVHNQCGCSDDDMCKDKNNCLLKKIVNLLLNGNKMSDFLSWDKAYLSERGILARQILDSFEIEECKNE